MGYAESGTNLDNKAKLSPVASETSFGAKHRSGPSDAMKEIHEQSIHEEENLNENG